MPKSSNRHKKLSEIESAIHLKMSPELLEYFSTHSVKYKETRKLPYMADAAGRWYVMADLDAFDEYLRQPWPKSPTAQRPSLPKKIRDEVMLEASCVCAICAFESAGEAAHIEPISLSSSHHPSNLIWLCPNHHTVVDQVAQMSNVKMEVAKTMKEMLVNRRMRSWRHEYAAERALLELVRAVETVTSMLKDAKLAEASEGLAAVAALDLKDLKALAITTAAASTQTMDKNSASLKAFAEKVSKSASNASATNPATLLSLEQETGGARDEYLRATDQAVCPLCDGEGHYDGADCPVCQGDGVISKSDADRFDAAEFEEVDCPVCRGTGVLRHDECPACHGDARIEKRFADRIEPKDYDFVECSLCDGSGQYDGYDCKVCGGEGEIPRRIYDQIDWSDFELVDCPECQGSGRSEYGADCAFCGGNERVFRRDFNSR